MNWEGNSNPSILTQTWQHHRLLKMKMETGNQGLGKKSHLAYFVKSKIFHDLLIVVFVENATYQDITVFEKNRGVSNVS